MTCERINCDCGSCGLLSALETQIALLKTEHAAQLREAGEQVMRLSAECEAARKELTTMTAMWNGLRAKIDELRGENEAVRADLSQALAERDEWKQVAEERQEEIARTFVEKREELRQALAERDAARQERNATNARFERMFQALQAIIRENTR